MNRPPFLALLGLALFCSLISARTAEITIDWPKDATGAYRFGTFTEKPVSERRTFDVPEGTSCRLTGPGFDFSFRIEKERVVFPHGLATSTMGVRYDPKTKTFSFRTVSVTLEVKDCDLPINWNGITWKNAEGETKLPEKRTYVVPYGRHGLRYSDTRLPFFVDEQGTITLDRQVPGITSDASTISVRGLPLQFTAPAPGWNIQKTASASPTAERTLHLLPNEEGYIFTAPGKPPETATFFLSQSGLIARDKSGPFAELVILKSEGGNEIGKVMIPNGEALYKERVARDSREKELRERLLAATASGASKKEFVIEDKMDFRDFPEELLFYPIDLPAGMNPSELALLRFDETTVRSVPFQIASIAKPDGSTQITIAFRSDLPRKGKRLFRLVKSADAGEAEKTLVTPVKLDRHGNSPEATFSNDRIAIKVPAGRQDFAGGKPLSDVPAPLIAISRGDDSPAVTGSFVAPDSFRVKSVDGKLLQSGPLFSTYEITYELNDSKKYVAKLELRSGESEVAIAESFTGFDPAQPAFLKLDYSKGLDPNRRLVASNGGYEAYSGDYDKGAGLDGKLNFLLSLYCANSLGIARATAFYNEDGKDALLLAINRPRDWVTSQRVRWSSAGLVENFVFYSQGNQKFLTAGLAGSRRFWVLGLIPREDLVLSVPDGVNAPAVGPEVRMLNRLSDWSLNSYKDRMPDWDEKLVAAPFDSTGFNVGKGFSAQPYDIYAEKVFKTRSFYQWLRNTSWDFSSEVGPVSFRDMPRMYGEYAASRATWTPEQRERIRSLLLFLADSSEDDANLPHHSMLGGHPNFIMDVKAVLPVAAATFPTHPKAKFWRDSFMDYYKEWLDRYARKDVPELNTVGGRWTENISCYVGQCFVGLLDSQLALKSYDGTSLGTNPQLLALIRWMRNSFMSPHEGVRLIPPQGAHARGFEPGYGPFRDSFFELSALLAENDPKLAQEMRWIETNGKEGVKPDIKSELFTDYGPVMHYDLGGPHESYAHMQLLNGMGYRWGQAGIVYYGARNKAWSFNNEETNGDAFRWDAVSGFNVGGRGLSQRPVDQLLYDFGSVQFYRQPGNEGDAYRARAMMLVRDDYLVLSDEVATPETSGTFTWVSTFELPQINQLRPGAPAVESTSQDKQPRRPNQPPGRVGQIRSFTGKGDFLTIVSPEPVEAQAQPFGATVSGDYVFCSQAPLSVAEKNVSFAGTYGYARPGQLCLFQGTGIALDGFAIRRTDGDFGLSAVAGKNLITGKIVGRSGGKIAVTPPASLDPAKATVTFDGKKIPSSVENGAVIFSVEIAQRDGLKDYAIAFE